MVRVSTYKNQIEENSGPDSTGNDWAFQSLGGSTKWVWKDKSSGLEFVVTETPDVSNTANDGVSYRLNVKASSDKEWQHKDLFQSKGAAFWQAREIYRAWDGSIPINTIDAIETLPKSFKKLSFDVAARYILADSLDNGLVGKTFEYGLLRFHVFRGAVHVWDLTNAGKRGKKVNMFSYNYDRIWVKDPEKEKLAGQFVWGLKSSDYETALKKAHILVAQGIGEIYTNTERGIDIDPPGFKPFKMETPQFSLSSDMKEFSIQDKKDTNNLPACIPSSKGGAADVKLFFRWIQDNHVVVKGMTYNELLSAMHDAGIKYHSFCRMD